MPCYKMTSRPASVEDYRLWQDTLGYLGSYADYLDAKSQSDNGTWFLCDYPVGDGKTCDRNMCQEHAKEVSPDVHYCQTHYKMWRVFVEKGGIDERLKNVIAFKSEK